MASALTRPPSERIRRIDVLAYVVGLMGLAFVADHGATLLADGVAASPIAGAAMGGFALLGAGLMYRNPGNVRDGTAPAPTYLHLLALVQTFALAAAAWTQFG